MKHPDLEAIQTFLAGRRKKVRISGFVLIGFLSLQGFVSLFVYEPSPAIRIIGILSILLIPVGFILTRRGFRRFMMSNEDIAEEIRKLKNWGVRM